MSLNGLDLMLANDADGAMRDSLLTQLVQWQQIAAVRLHEPVRGDEYRRRQARHDALGAAQSVVRIVWRRLHRTTSL